MQYKDLRRGRRTTVVQLEGVRVLVSARAHWVKMEGVGERAHYSPRTNGHEGEKRACIVNGEKPEV